MFKNLKLLIFFTIISRLMVFLYSIIFPVISENGERVSPLIMAINIGDMGYYYKFKEDPWGRLISMFNINNYTNLMSWFAEGFYPGPIFPWLLNITNYIDGNTFFLSSIYFSISIITCLIWMFFFKNNGATKKDQIVILIYPFGLYFTLIISTDILFSFLVAFIYVLLCLDYSKKIKYNYIIAFFLIIISILTRPNSLILLPVYICYIIINKDKFSTFNFYVINVVTCVLLLLSMIYYYPYFIAFKTASEKITYFGYSQAEYFNGLFDEIPIYLNYLFSWSALTISKFLYITGLRPSYSEVPIHYVLLRSLGGIFILPGIFYLIFVRSKIEKIFVILFLIPILSGASQERYILPIYPILIFSGIQFWKFLFKFHRIK